MEAKVTTPYGTAVFMNDCPPEKAAEILARYAHSIGFETKEGEGKNGKAA